MTEKPHPQHNMLSLIVPMYNEEEGLEVFFSTIIPILDRLDTAWEMICINDGSTDNTLARLQAVAENDSRIQYISLSRNFGKEVALSAGLEYATGNAAIPIDADLQDPPELIPQLVAKWQEGYKVVLATRKTRLGDTFFKKWTAGVFYRILSAVSDVTIPPNTGDFRLIDRDVIEVIKRLPERTRFMKGLFAWVGFKTATIYFERQPRAVGSAKINYRQLWHLAKDGIFSFTTLPLKFVTYTGIFVSLCGFAYALFLIFYVLITGVDAPGYASLMVVVLVLGGIQLLSIGLIGEYVGRVFREVKQRPLYVIEESSYDEA